MNHEQKTTGDISFNNISGGNISTGDIVTGNHTEIHGNAEIIGGNQTQAHRDVISGSQVGFSSQQDQQQFIEEINKLRKLILDVKGQIELEASNQSGAQELMTAMSLQIKALQEAIVQASQLPIGKETSSEKTKSLEDYLQSAQILIEQAQQFGEKVTALAIKIAPLALPILTYARKLLGLP